jgi:hypothetical protein
MTEFERFDQNARTKGILIDTKLLVLLVVGSVNRDRIPAFKRTSGYTPADWESAHGYFGANSAQIFGATRPCRIQHADGPERTGTGDRESDIT